MTALCYRRRRHGARHRTGLRRQVQEVQLRTPTLTRPSVETRRCPRSHMASSQTYMRATRGSDSRLKEALCTISTQTAPEHHRPPNHIHRYDVTYLIQSSCCTLRLTHIGHRICRSGVTSSDMKAKDRSLHFRLGRTSGWMICSSPTRLRTMRCM